MPYRVFASADELIEHLEALSAIPSVEADHLTELDHGLQSAARCAERAPDDVELQVAALIHDLAHLWDGPGQPRHALMGADSVRGLMGERVANLVAGHVPAKRYLVTTDPAYRAQLSADSTMTLAAQGGDMDVDELAWFESLPDWEAMLVLRRADDAAKVPGAVVPGLDRWRDAIRAVAAARSH
jgi:predicted HD phosphohydrolase